MFPYAEEDPLRSKHCKKYNEVCALEDCSDNSPTSISMYPKQSMHILAFCSIAVGICYLCQLTASRYQTKERHSSHIGNHMNEAGRGATWLQPHNSSVIRVSRFSSSEVISQHCYNVSDYLHGVGASDYTWLCPPELDALSYIYTLMRIFLDHTTGHRLFA